jgi:hypothetical protein
VVQDAVEIFLIGVGGNCVDSLGPAADCSSQEKVASLTLVVSLREFVPRVRVPPADEVDIGAKSQQGLDNTQRAVRLNDFGQNLVDFSVGKLGAGLGGEAISDPAECLLISILHSLGLEEPCGLFGLVLHGANAKDSSGGDDG